MLKTYNYAPILSLISTPRINSYRNTFQTVNDSDLYGVYIWAQHASASLYPLAQNLEVSLRNAIDAEATKRFNQFWWSNIKYANVPQAQMFMQNIQAAIAKLNKDWQKKERARLNLSFNAPIPTPMPSWSHDQIIAATDFSTWQFILTNAFNAPTPANNANYLWPISVGRVFKNFSSIDTNPKNARQKIIGIVKELRDYRNRLFHHEPIWTKEPTVVNARTAIDTVRRKINKIEGLLNAIDTRKVAILDKVGVINHARRICSEDELNIYRDSLAEPHLTSRKKRTLRSLTAKARSENVTVAWTYGIEVYGLYRIR